MSLQGWSPCPTAGGQSGGEAAPQTSPATTAGQAGHVALMAWSWLPGQARILEFARYSEEERRSVAQVPPPRRIGPNFGGSETGPATGLSPLDRPPIKGYPADTSDAVVASSTHKTPQEPPASPAQWHVQKNVQLKGRPRSSDEQRNRARTAADAARRCRPIAKSLARLSRARRPEICRPTAASAAEPSLPASSGWCWVPATRQIAAVISRGGLGPTSPEILRSEVREMLPGRTAGRPML